MNLEQARFNMIEQQIRPWEVLDGVVLDLLKQVPREDFVPARYAGLAFADLEIPIGHGQSMLSPKLEARVIQSLGLKKSDKVLEIGTGSGYMTALLARMAGSVVSVDCVEEFTAGARRKLQQHGLDNVTLETGYAAQGWSKHAPYDVIVLTGSVPLLADAFRQQLNPGGRLFAVVGEAPVMEATLVSCPVPHVYRTEKLFELCVPTLVNAEQPERFVF
ncbi:protein-L-isoaspartate O-methyltransferase [mine drainage metagenome]|uniref:Protein-L-isoaspartate O-methyltransferase n=1 Tax=mine drainage metagenome TaxID=410659 RepID=A0A1J5QY82_9ZZZZ